MMNEYKMDRFARGFLTGILFAFLLAQLAVATNRFVETVVKPELQQMSEDIRYVVAHLTILRLEPGDRFTFYPVSFLGHDMLELDVEGQDEPIYTELRIVEMDGMPARMDHPYQLYKFGRDLLDRPALIVLDLDPAVLVAQPNPSSGLPETVPSSKGDFSELRGYIKLFRTKKFGGKFDIYDIHDSNGHIVKNVALGVTWPNGRVEINRWVDSYGYARRDGYYQFEVNSFAPKSDEKPYGCSNLDYARYGNRCSENLGNASFAFPFCQALQGNERVMVYPDFDAESVWSYVLIVENGATFHGDVDIDWPNGNGYNYGEWFGWSSCGGKDGMNHIILK
jgi:hypothetical protein